MKLKRTLLFLFFLLSISTYSNSILAQTPSTPNTITVHAGNRYSIKITIWDFVLIKGVMTPNEGFNYKFQFNYKIEYFGNPPGGMWTFQGDICNKSFFSISKTIPNSNPKVETGIALTANEWFATKTPNETTAGDICLDMIFLIHGEDINGRYPMVVSPLPIELTSFEAAQQNNAVELTWETASERNNDFFSVERTLDGVNYETVGTVKGAGNSSTAITYSFTDVAPHAGVSYYRLRQTDYNGDTETFEVKSIDFRPENQPTVNVFPNPTKDGNVTLKFNKAVKNVQVSMYTLTGVLVKTEEIQLDFLDNVMQLVLPEGDFFYLSIVSDNQTPLQVKVARI